MSATATLDAPTQPPLPAQVMLHFVATLLTPMFATATGGDTNLARTVAIETLSLYRTENYAGLITAAQIIAFGLASVGSLSLSMAAGQTLSASMVVRLRANANALTRTAERLSRTVLQTVPGTPQAADQPPPDPAELQAGLDAARQAVEQAQNQFEQAQVPSAAPSQNPGLRNLSQDEKQHRIAWAGAMADVADEFMASLPMLPPAEQKAVSNHIATLNRCVASLLAGDELPQLPVIPGLPMLPFPRR